MICCQKLRVPENEPNIIKESKWIYLCIEKNILKLTKIILFSIKLPKQIPLAPSIYVVKKFQYLININIPALRYY